MSSSDSDSSDSYTFTNTASVKFVSKKKVPPPSDSDSDSDSSDSSTFRSKKNTKKPQPQEQESHTTKEKDIDLVEVDDSFDFDNCASSTPKKKTAALSKAKAIREKLAAAQTNTLIELDSDSDVEVTSPPSTSKNITTLSSSSLPESYATIKLRLNNSQVVPLKINTTLRISSEVTKYITSTHSGTSIKIVFDGDEILAETCQTLDVEDDDQFDVTFTSTEIPRLKIKTTLNGKDYKTWSLKISDNFEKLYEAAGKHYGGVVELTFDGDVINGSSCLEDLDMEEDDVIEVKLVSSKKKLVQAVVITARRNKNSRQTRKYRLSTADLLSKIIPAHTTHYKSAKNKSIRFYYNGSEVTGMKVGDVGYDENGVIDVIDNGKRP